ncbi:Peptidase C39 like family protein [Histomonas meleagridis]|uniref:Peptidase C39 like family protein n=1 Tax=Histomonas meleagridis TaxID=135588 RepID=UPI00355979F0|nr:Peptidase C39 like family protein [Histomonas meleagridis]KAH0799305.1 Peptidase C39 like family protein [Histomonas meleagridis]
MSSGYDMKMDMVKLISLMANVLLLCVAIGMAVAIGLKEGATIYEYAPVGGTEVNTEQILDIKVPYYGEGNLTPYASYVNSGRDRLNSKYFTMLDYYNMKSDDTLTIFPKFKTFLQTSKYTDSIACFNMILNYLGYDTYDEPYLAEVFDVGTDKRKAVNHTGYGTPPRCLEAGIQSLGFDTLNQTTLPNSTTIKENYYEFKNWILDSIRYNNPIIFLTVEWGASYVVPIGVDTMGTDYGMDDVLIIANPHDLADHRIDGYTVWGLYRFYKLVYWCSIPQYDNNFDTLFSFIQINGTRRTP